jgi:lipoprotein-releasing system permease protein
MLTVPRLIALRYFVLGKRRGWAAFIPALVLASLLAVNWLALPFISGAHTPRGMDFRAQYLVAFQASRLGLLVLFTVVLYITLLIRRLTIFTSINIAGLFLASAAMVIVLSVMSGFENDLKRKILGNNAHVVVTRPDQPFTDYTRLRAEFAKVQGVVGATPYVTNEVMISSQSNLSGVVVKGIDPATVGQVTDLVKNMKTGGLEYLVDPKQLLGSGGPSIFDDDDLLKPRAPKVPAKKDEAKKDEAKKDEPKKGEAKNADDEEKPPEGALKFQRRVVPGVIIGIELAKNLRLYLGDDVNIVSPFGGIGPTGPIPKSKPFRVAGEFFSGMFEYDTKYVYITLPDAQKFFNMPDEVTGIELKLTDPDRTEPVLAALQKIAGPGYEVQDWKQLNRSLFSALKIEKILMFVLLCFGILVAAFSIIANGTMLVLEKGKEVAILKSMGARDSTVLGAFMVLGLLIGGIGTVTGITAGVAACWALGRFGIPLNTDVYYITTLPVQMNPYEIAAVFAAALAIALLATLYPAWMASRLRPVDGLRR